MATASKSDGIEIELYKPDESALKYEAHVLALIAADENRTDEQIRDGFHASVKVVFPKVENGKPQIEKHKRWFRESAGAHDMSAKVAEEIDGGDTVTVRYIVVPKIVRPRKPKNTGDDTPESVAA